MYSSMRKKEVHSGEYKFGVEYDVIRRRARGTGKRNLRRVRRKVPQPILARYLHPDRLVHHGCAWQLPSKRPAPPRSSTRRRDYEYVFRTMRYDKTAPLGHGTRFGLVIKARTAPFPFVSCRWRVRSKFRSLRDWLPFPADNHQRRSGLPLCRSSMLTRSDVPIDISSMEAPGKHDIFLAPPT